MRVVKTILIAALVLLLFVGLVIYFFIKSTLPEIEGTLVCPGLKAPVEIARNRWGIPFIKAQNREDLFLAIGFVHAQDRLFQMDLSRRLGQGRLSEIFGRRALAMDIYRRSNADGEFMAATLRAIRPEYLALLERYCHGINCFCSNQNLPPEFHLLGYRPEPWTVTDTLYLLKNMEEMLVDSGAELSNAVAVRALGANRAGPLLFGAADQPVIATAEIAALQGNPVLARLRQRERRLAEAQIGSNSWVIAGKKTYSGKPLLANDPHLEQRFPALFYQLWAQCPGYELSGNTLPGIPLIVIGHNSQIGWGLTNLYTDACDFFQLTINPGNPRQYRWNGQWRNFRVVREYIPVKGEEARPLEILLSAAGPVQKAGHQHLAVHSITHYPAQTINAFFTMNLCHRLPEFTAALRLITSPAQHVVFADRDGHIGYYPAGWIPLRARGDGSLPLRAEAYADLWQGFYPEEKKPLLLDPAQGFIVAANNPVLPAGREPFFTASWPIVFRSERIEELLQAKQRLGIEDCRKFQCDTYLKSAEFLLAQIANMEVGSNEAEFVLRQLTEWDRRTEEGLAPYLFYSLEQQLTKNIFAPHSSDPEYGAVISPSWLYRLLKYPRLEKENRSLTLLAQWCDNPATKSRENLRTVLEKSLRDTYHEYVRASRGGLESSKWENLHTLSYNHTLGSFFLFRPILNRGPFPIKGGKDVVLCSGFTAADHFQATQVSAFRMILDFSAWDNSVIVYPAGQSGHFLSPFYDDQIGLYIGLQYRRLEELSARRRTLHLLGQE